MQNQADMPRPLRVGPLARINPTVEPPQFQHFLREEYERYITFGDVPDIYRGRRGG